MKRFVLALVLFAAVLAWAGDLYKWQDENGVTRYSDRVPTTVKQFTKLKGAPKPAEIENVNFPLPDESRRALQKHPVTLYSFPDCGEICSQAEAFLDKRGVPYVLKNTDRDKRELLKLTGKLEAPALVLGNTAPVIGFEEGRWGRELDLAGYAKHNPRLEPGTSTALKPPPAPVKDAVVEAGAESAADSAAEAGAAPAPDTIESSPEPAPQ